MDKYQILRAYGEDILQSEVFSRACEQKHHFRSDVGSHSIHTALTCMSMLRALQRIHVQTDPEVMVVAALSHDLGILGRKAKYSSGLQCIRQHPVDSAEVIRSLRENVDPKVCDVITSHMFPLFGRVPRSTEAWVLTLADKWAAATDLFIHYSVPQVCS